MDRFIRTDPRRARIEPHCLGKRTAAGRSERDNRLSVEAWSWIARTGRPCRDLPALVGTCSTAFRRFREWRAADVFKRVFGACSGEPDMDAPWSMPRSSRFIGMAKAQKWTQSHAIGRSKAGMRTDPCTHRRAGQSCSP
ncbi:transposase [Sphingomonas sp. Leaf231]|uniref:transposase n=1 Tax=Sphingomonas sp. Leaf231 TaxID=1736301 RepID=UPI0009E89DAA